MTPIKLFWWNDHPNFGDAINTDIVSHVSGRPVQWASPQDCELLAIGSVMAFVAGVVHKKEGPPKTIWGSGVMDPTPGVTGYAQNDHVRVVSCRGPLSAIVTGHGDLPMGDPGLLADRVYGKVEKAHRIGVVPHHSQYRERDFINALRSDPRLTLIDVRNADGGAVVRKIAACEYIISSSLHGLIVADAYGVPNFWSDGPWVGKTNFKFLDYALSVGRSLLHPEPLEQAIAKINDRAFEPFWYLRHLEPVKDAIEAAFPKAMRAPGA